MFWFDLAERLGMSVEAAQETISPEEFVLWKARELLQPRGPASVEFRWADLMCLLHQTNSTSPLPDHRYRYSQTVRKRIAMAELGDTDEDEDEEESDE